MNRDFRLWEQQPDLPSNISSREYHCHVHIPIRASFSAYLNDALRLKAEHDRRLRGIDDFIAAYEAEHGEITDEEMEAAYQRAKARAIVVRGGHVVDRRRRD